MAPPRTRHQAAPRRQLDRAGHGAFGCFEDDEGQHEQHERREAAREAEAEFDRIYAINVKSLFLTARHAVPAIHQSRDFAIAGGLMSYAGSFLESHRQAGIYTGRILKGDKPADLAVQRVTKVELFINLKTAKNLGITFPLSLLGRADQLIE